MDYTWQYYDVLLLGVFGAMLFGVAVGAFTSVAVTMSVPVLALVAIALIAHGLFVNGPVDDLADLTDDVDALN